MAESPARGGAGPKQSMLTQSFSSDDSNVRFASVVDTDLADEHAIPVSLPVPLNRTCYERIRDRILKNQEKFCWKPLILLWMVLVVVDGAFFFFVMVGAHNITPEETAKQALNWGIQGLNLLFTTSAIFTMPWRWANAVHLTGCSGRVNTVGHDLYGASTTDIWFHIPLGHRAGIVLFMLLNCIAQYINQIFRIIYFDHVKADGWPGVLLVNLFFGLSFLCGIIAGIYQGQMEGRLRKARPRAFGPTPVEQLKRHYHRWRNRNDVRGTESLSLSSDAGDARYSRAT